MSHVATIKTQMLDVTAINAACKRLGIPESVNGRHQLYDGAYTGIGVKLPGWKYSVVIEPTGELKYDNYKGQWGHIDRLNEFRQAYGVEKAKIEARKKGMSVTETKLPDGRIQVRMVAR